VTTDNVSTRCYSGCHRIGSFYVSSHYKFNFGWGLTRELAGLSQSHTTSCEQRGKSEEWKTEGKEGRIEG